MMIESGQRYADTGTQVGDPGGRHRAIGGLAPGAPAREPCALPEDSHSERLRLLLATVESHIIPRLVLAHRATPGAAASAPWPAGQSRDDDVAALVQILLDPGVGAEVGFSEALLARGVTLDAIYLDVFAPAARRLGELWSDDQCDFVEVTIALGLLQQLLRRFAPRFRPESGTGDPWRRALFAAAPGEQHTFGLMMIAQYFLRAGWDASLLTSAASEDILQLVQHERVSLVGLSMSYARHVPVLRSLIERMRAGSLNTDLRVIVGGVAFVDQPELASELGADGTAVDATQAIDLAGQMVL